MARKFEHKGLSIEVEEPPKPKRGRRLPKAPGIDGVLLDVSIDGRRIDVVQDDNGHFSSAHLPYEIHKSVDKLTKDIVDNSPDFASERKK